MIDDRMAKRHLSRIERRHQRRRMIIIMVMTAVALSVVAISVVTLQSTSSVFGSKAAADGDGDL